ncbi:MAG: amidohydrolase [Armatimonadota bacterium]|nr:amidohydrolase [Armatimonadota bacterium]
MAADIVFENCNGYTLDKSGTRFTSLAVKDGKIIAVGSEAETAPLIESETRRIDLGGRTVIPGLIDAHNHLIHYGIEATRSVDLTGCTSIAEVQDRLRKFRREHPHEAWLLGHRFDQELFAEGRWPTKDDLDEVSEEVPIMISRVCLHAVVVNSAALALAQEHLGQEQLKTGILVEDSADLIWRQIPDPTPEQISEAALWAMHQARRAGLTGVHCMVTSREELEALLTLRAGGQLPIRLTVCCPYSMADYLEEQSLKPRSGDDLFRIGPLKIFMDGSMGARTAALKEPYADDPDNTGVLFRSDTELADILREIQSRGFQAAIHAIGDLAVETALRGIAKAAAFGNDGNYLRHRIEHASVLAPDLINEMARLAVVAVVQPQFVITDFWTRERVGEERYRWCYPFKTMLATGVALAMGSDCPVERLDAVELIHRAVNREPFSAAECLTAEETVRAYSLGSAYAGHSERFAGSLEVGKYADFTVISQDIFAVEPEAISETQVQATVVGGEMLEA